MYNDLEHGGLRVPHIQSFYRALKMKWIKKLIDPLNNSSWKCLLLDTLEKIGGDKILFLQEIGISKCCAGFNSFWIDVFQNWAKLNQSLTASPNDIISQPLWYNPEIRIDKKMVFFKNMVDCDIYFINDIIDEHGFFLNCGECNEKYGCSINHVSYAGLVNAIPKHWKNILKNNLFDKEIKNVNIQYLKRKDKVSKIFYNMFLKSVKKDPIKTQDFFHTQLNTIIHEKNWKKIYKSPFIITSDSKLQSLQFKINHNIIFTNDRLFKCKLSETELCTFCFETKETLIHLFYKCSYSRSVWFGLLDDLYNICGLFIDKNITHFILGLTNHPNQHIINLCFLIIKNHIYLCKFRKTRPNYKTALQSIKDYRKLELFSLYMLSPKIANNIR